MLIDGFFIDRPHGFGRYRRERVRQRLGEGSLTDLSPPRKALPASDRSGDAIVSVSRTTADHLATRFRRPSVVIPNS